LKLTVSWKLDLAEFELEIEQDCTPFEAVELSQQLALAIRAIQQDTDNTITQVAKALDKFAAMCDNCGKEDYVNFKPKQGKQFLCNTCFNTKRGR
jgi:CxxC-x17-CxxC domain-containing protein